MKKIFLAGLMAVSFAVSSGLFAAANAAQNDYSRSSIYSNYHGAQG